MITFIIGATQSGKSTFAKELASKDGRQVISAGKWARDLAGITEQGSEATKVIAEIALKTLTKDPLYASHILEALVEPLHNSIIEGCRNPTDILHIARKDDRVIDLGGKGVPGWEEDGLAAIRACRKHLSHIGVTWLDYHRHFATLPQPLTVSLETRYLHGDDRLGTEEGQIIALESYEGTSVTACWMSKDGGSFHDLPLSAFVTNGLGVCTDDAVEYLRQNKTIHGDHCYSLAGPGGPVIELPLHQNKVSVFNRDRRWVGTGIPLWMIHWPQGNLLLYLIELEGQLFLWPPHKLLWNPLIKVLPDWKKNRNV